MGTLVESNTSSILWTCLRLCFYICLTVSVTSQPLIDGEHIHQATTPLQNTGLNMEPSEGSQSQALTNRGLPYVGSGRKQVSSNNREAIDKLRLVEFIVA